MSNRPDTRSVIGLPEIWTEQELFDFKLSFDSHNNNHLALLYRILRKADSMNLERHRIGFPREVGLVEAWKRGEIAE